MLQSALLSGVPGIVHGFGTRHDRPEDIFAAYWQQRPIQRERHGTDIAIVTEARQQCGEADGMLTAHRGLALAIMTADCAPVLLARRDGGEVAALHIGWRGAADGMVDQFARLLASRGDAPENWLAVVGPTARPCCYSVSPEIVDLFRERYAAPAELIAPRPGRLNIGGIVQWQLERAGFGASADLGCCTMCDTEPDTGGFRFHSYRRDQATRTPLKDIQWSVIARVKKTSIL